MPRHTPNSDLIREALRESPPVPSPATPAGGREAQGADAQEGGGQPAAPAGASPTTDAPATGADAPASDAPAAGPEATTDTAGTTAEPDAGLAEVVRQRDEYLALAQRTQADFENFRRRSSRDVAAAGARATGGLVRELLPVVDNLERALAMAQPDSNGLVRGVELVHADLVGVLERSGVKSFSPDGERFDPTQHEAISTQAADGVEPGLVVEVVQKGYQLKDAVLRPARVVVSA